MANMAITYSGVRNPKWVNSQQTMIECEVNWDHVDFEDWSPCGLVASGDEPYIHDIFNRCVAGDFGTIADYVRPANIPATNGQQQPAKDLFSREKRNRLLADCDMMMLADRYNAMTTEQQTAWTNYRQALRDMPSESQYQNMEGIFNDDTYEFDPSVTITWPTKPA